MEYYKNNAKQYIADTFDCDLANLYSLLERYLNNGDKVLDLGFGSGRDSLYFSQKYNVVSIDPVDKFCEHARNIGLKNVYQMKAQDISFENEFDGIWACASLLHINQNELKDVFYKCNKALKTNGHMYCSFKYGDFQGERNGRFFLDLTESTLEVLLENTGLAIEKITISDDVRKDRNEKWLNAILKKA